MHPGNSPPAVSSDSTILRLLHAQDGRGLRMLLEQHGAHVRRGVARSLGAMLEVNELDEAMNAATYNAWRAVGTYSPDKGPLRAWFFVIARNAAREVVRRRRRRGYEVKGDELERMPAAEAAEPAAAPAPYLDALRASIAALPRLQRLVIEADLASGDVADATELATKLKTSRNSVYVSRSNARKALRRALAERGFEAGAEQQD